MGRVRQVLRLNTASMGTLELHFYPAPAVFSGGLADFSYGYFLNLVQLETLLVRTRAAISYSDVNFQETDFFQKVYYYKRFIRGQVSTKTLVDCKRPRVNNRGQSHYHGQK